MTQTTQSSAGQYSISVVGTNYLNVNPVTQAQMVPILQSVQAHYPDLDALFFTSNLEASCVAFLLALRQINYLPKMVYLNLCQSTPTLVASVGADTYRWMLGALSWDSRFQLTVDPRVYPEELWPSTMYIDPVSNATVVQPNAPMVFSNDFNRTFNRQPVLGDGLSVFNAVAAQKVLESTLVDPMNKVDGPEALRTAALQMYANTPFGLLQYDPYGRYQGVCGINSQTGVAGVYDVLHAIGASCCVLYRLRLQCRSLTLACAA
jgi:hypothetical protein